MDPQQQQAANALAGMGAGVAIVVVLLVFAVLAFMIFCLWRIFAKAGLGGALSLLVLVPGVGGLIVLCMLAFMDWKVVPAPQQYGGYTPPPPVGGGYPPQQFPPSNYPPRS